ncbi:MAG: endolytic transglycosylase MltG [Patescibacteria group bacterium]
MEIIFKNRKILIAIVIICAAVFLFEVYVPKSFSNSKYIYYSLEKGSSFNNVSGDLAKQEIIHNALFFNLYAIISLNYSRLQAGNYQLSQSMSIAQIVKKFATGDIVKEKITIVEGWNIEDIAKNLANRKIYSKENFILVTKVDFSNDFLFLKEKPKNLGLEGYIFPDTYYVLEKSVPEELLKAALSNFDKKITSDLKQEIEKQQKSIFKIITMASMLEKEVKSMEDKKIISGILWKRIKEGIPLQVDATVNYITGKNDEKAAINDTKIDSPYNTYKYYGLPQGPISNPGMDSILAAIYPEETDYWYYLSADGNGTIIFSKTLEEHIEAQRKYFK